MDDGSGGPTSNGLVVRRTSVNSPLEQKNEKTLRRKAHRELKFQTAEEARYKERCPKERFNALFKDFYGGRNIFYKGHKKVSCHIMFGVLALTAATLLSFVQ